MGWFPPYNLKDTKLVKVENNHNSDNSHNYNHRDHGTANFNFSPIM